MNGLDLSMCQIVTKRDNMGIYEKFIWIKTK